MMPPMAVSRVRLPRGVREPYTVYLNGVPQEPGRDFTVERGVLVFQTELRKEGRLGFWRWFWGAWGIGTYRKNDQVDVAWEVGGAPAYWPWSQALGELGLDLDELLGNASGDMASAQRLVAFDRVVRA